MYTNNHINYNTPNNQTNSCYDSSCRIYARFPGLSSCFYNIPVFCCHISLLNIKINILMNKECKIHACIFEKKLIQNVENKAIVLIMKHRKLSSDVIRNVNTCYIYNFEMINSLNSFWKVFSIKVFIVNTLLL